jgi:CRISPR system Cascade subunit CasD
VSGFILRLAGPLQSWGGRSAFTPQRHTAPFPTRSALIGMFAAAEGRHRSEDPSHYTALEFTVRIDRPGHPLVDYHTVGGGRPKHLTAATSGGDHKGDAVITRRHYLADAVFIVAVTGPPADTTRIARALHHPHWNPYLGRRSCIPDEPFLLRTNTTDPIGELLHHVPLSPAHTNQEHRATTADTVPVEFIWETYPLGPLPADALTTTITDVPTCFTQHHRSHTRRRIHRTTHHLPAQLRAEQHNLHQQLIDYAKNPQQETRA